ncbi:uncharacterized protein LOC110095664 [Dendrobium catenatum]|uniref:uncharacterized protein LOC110095664 n=1 Tax=Dendrobium catenatum TaxID=906689 RepID=UPI0009F5E8B2|nr:uncharacterized protein LOC110095664 [Dendrobium catenatum]
MHDPSIVYFQALKRLLRYVQGTLHYGLPIIPSEPTLNTYIDADWAFDHSDWKSITGFCSYLGANLISWCVKKQITMARSSTEAEYRALASATSDTLWLRHLLAEFHISQSQPAHIHCDNLSAP